MTIAQLALEGLPLSECFVVDGHMHNGRASRFYSHFDYYRDLIAQMDAIGINAGIVSNLWNTGEAWQQHPEVLRMCQRYPGRFYGYLSPNPNLDNFRQELEVYGREPAFIGIKLHPVEHLRDLMCPEYRYAYDFAAERRMPVLLHTWGMEDMRRFYEIAPQHPDTTLILGHSGGDEEPLQEAIRLAATFENIYLDIACTYVWNGAIEAMARGASAQKVLYGSDAYWNSMEASIGRVALAQITEKEKRQILGENARRIFHM